MGEVGSVVTWVALAAVTGLLVTLGGVVVRLMDRLNKSEALATAAASAAAEARVISDRAAGALVEHRIQCAREFISQEALKSFRAEIMDTMHRIEERLDKIPHRA